MWDDAHLAARFVEELILLGASFSCTRFGAIWTPWEFVAGDDGQQFLVELALPPGFAGGGVDGVGKMAHGIQ